jgi:hypothetical protein
MSACQGITASISPSNFSRFVYFLAVLISLSEKPSYLPPINPVLPAITGPLPRRWIGLSRVSLAGHCLRFIRSLQPIRAHFSALERPLPPLLGSRRGLCPRKRQELMEPARAPSWAAPDSSSDRMPRVKVSTSVRNRRLALPPSWSHFLESLPPRPWTLGERGC